MAVTGACAEVVYLSWSEDEPDFDRPVSNEELVQAVKNRLRELPADERVDEPVTPSTPFGIQARGRLPAYLTRREAVAAYGDGDPAVDELHVFQGDLFIGLSMFTPAGRDDPWVVSHGVVISHHCEWTKAKSKLADGEDWPILVAPAHELHTALQSHEQRLAREGRFRYYLHLPAEGPVDRELVVDLRLIQPLSAREVGRCQHWACMAPPLIDALRSKVVEFIFREFET